MFSDNQNNFSMVVFLYIVKNANFRLIFMQLIFLQTVLNSSNTIDKADEYEYFKFGFDSKEGSLSYSLLSAPGNYFMKSKGLGL